jgi:hypothetical protein
MKIHKVGRTRPILYKGQFSVPNSVIERLAIAKNHLELAQIAHFNGKINQYYMTIDNLLAAVITAKEGCLTTTSHTKKIEKFFTFMSRKARLRKIDKEDFYEFYELWADSRYRVYFPKSEVVEKIRLFTNHLFEFVTTETARFYKSDETILTEKVDNQLKVYRSECIEKEASFIHEKRQMEAEEIGDRGGPGLGMKLSNPWNFMELSLVSDRKDISELIDSSEDAAKYVQAILQNWEHLINEVFILNISNIASEIATAMAQKNSTTVDSVIPEAIEMAEKHPAAHRFRLVLDLSYDSSEPKRTIENLSMALKAFRDNPKKVRLDGWEIKKEFNKHLK